MTQVLPFFTLLTFATAICGLLAVVAWQRRETPDSRPFSLLMLTVATWSFLYALQLASFKATTKLVWAVAQYPFIAFVPIFWLSFILLYTGRTGRMMMVSLFQKPKLYRGQFAALISGALAPWIGNAIYIFGLSSFLSLDPTPFLFTFSGVLFAGAIFQGGMLNVMPVAYSAVFNNMRDGIFILNTDDIVLGMNPAAGKCAAGK